MIPSEKILHHNKWVRPRNNFRYMGEEHYEEPVFANHYYSFQIDLIDQSREGKNQFTTPELIDGRELTTEDEKKVFPPYIFITQNVNTKYVRAIAVKGKTTEDMLDCFKLFWEKTDHKLVSIVSDAEPASDTDEVKGWCHDNKISIKIIPSTNHTAHAVIDRLIRTLRDMNTVEEKSHEDSTHPKYRDFSIYRLKKLIGLYNNNRHSSTGHTPKEMDANRKLEEDWIVKKLYERERRRKISNFQLPEGRMARLIKPTYRKMGKKRYTVTPEKYYVKQNQGKQYVIMAEDGSTMVVPRWRLAVHNLNKSKLAKTIGKANTGVPKEILGYQNGEYTVDWHVPKGAPQQIATASIIAIRTDPYALDPTEKAFWKGKEIPKAVLKRIWHPPEKEPEPPAPPAPKPKKKKAPPPAEVRRNPKRGTN
jgi:hypothetical protein